MIESQFLQAIAEAPEDDSHRLVYADWLDDQGQSARAEFIRLQVELETLNVGDPMYPEKLARSRRCGILTAEIPDPSLSQLPGTVVQFRRGFPHSVEISAGEFLQLDPNILTIIPVEYLSLKPTADTGALLKKRNDLASLRGLRLDNWTTAELGKFVCGRSPLKELRALRMSPSRMRNSERFFGRSNLKFDLPSLDSLWIDGKPNDWTSLLTMCDNPLRRVFLTGYSERPDDDGFYNVNIWDHLAQSKHWETLEEAIIWCRYNRTSTGNSQETPDMHYYPEMLSNAKRLQFLNVSSWSVKSLVNCQDWGRLKSLMIMQNPGLGETPCLLNAEQMRNIEALWVGYWGFTDYQTKKVNWGKNSPLQNLKRLTIMCMAADDVRHLVSGPYLPQLQRLDILMYLDDKSLDKLCRTTFPQLRRLTLCGYGSTFPIETLVKSKAFPNLCTLQISGGWGFGSENTLENLAQALAQCKSMPHLSLIARGNDSYILRDGKAFPVPQHICPFTADWWLHDPYDDTLAR